MCIKIQYSGQPTHLVAGLVRILGWVIDCIDSGVYTMYGWLATSVQRPSISGPKVAILDRLHCIYAHYVSEDIGSYVVRNADS